MGELPTPVASAGPETTGVFFSPLLERMLALLIFALADPLPGPAEEPAPPDLAPIEPLVLRDDRFRFGIGVSVMMGAYSWENRWTAAATFALDLRADLGLFELVLSPHATVHVHHETAALFGFEGQLVF